MNEVYPAFHVVYLEVNSAQITVTNNLYINLSTILKINVGSYQYCLDLSLDFYLSAVFYFTDRGDE